MGGDLNPNSTAGQVESIGDFAVGLTHVTGWRRQLARWSIVVLFAMPVLVVIATHL